MDHNDYRKMIDDIDRQLLALFGQRMEVAAAIAAYKKEHNLPVLDGKREREKLLDVAAKTPDDLKDYAEGLYTDAAYQEKRTSYSFAQPFTKESLLYRELFEKFYPGQAEMVTDFWMPNKAWAGCNVSDPSARVLTNYGDSGK